MHQALEVKPANGVAEANLAAFLWLRGEYATASTRLRDVLKRDPPCVPARVNLASQLLNDREPAEALQLLAEAPPPGRLGIHWRAQKAGALIMLGRDAEARAELDSISEPPGDGEILIVWRRIVLAVRSGNVKASEPLADRMTELVSHETAALLEHRIIGHFELARYRYQRGERERAFDHWEQAHKLLARTQPFSRQLHSEFVDASIEVFNPERRRHGATSDDADSCPIFIVGMPRSGTTLVEQILAAHPAIHGAGERAAIYETLSQLGAPPGTADSVRKTAGLDRQALTEIGQAYLRNLHALAPTAQYITDKMPGNALHLGFISTILPGARVIHCTRDPRDIGLSIFQFRFFGYHPYAHDLADLGWYIGKYQQLMDHWQAVVPIPILTVRLTDWVGDFQGTLRRVLAFLDLSYAPECERFHLADRKVRTASRDQVRRPVNAGGLNRWQQYAHRLGPLIEELKSAGALWESVDFTLSRSTVA
jgi:tetratricopeptide (TPR) repeat protein